MIKCSDFKKMLFTTEKIIMTVIRELYIFVKSKSFLYPDENLKKPKSLIIFWKQILATLICTFW